MREMLEPLCLPIANIGSLLGLLCITLILWRLAYRLTLSPLRRIPGPVRLKTTSAFNKYYEFSGGKRIWLHDLHHQYGPVVAISPNEVSFASASGLKQIYSAGTKDFLKTELYELFRQAGHMCASFLLPCEKSVDMLI